MKKYIGLAVGIVVIIVLAIMTQQKQEQPTPTQTNETPVTEEKTFTADEVASHNTAEDCYAIVDSKVYDLTSWISRHPGGPAAIQSLCGHDGTDAFHTQHDNSAQPNAMLNSFLIGSLAQ